MPSFFNILLLCLLLPLASAEWPPKEPELDLLTETEWKYYLKPHAHEQPKWKRDDYTTSSAHLQLQKVAQLHQEGDLDKAVQILKTIVQKADAEHHGEAYALLSKVLSDQGKYELADRAMAKATRIYNEGLKDWSLT